MSNPPANLKSGNIFSDITESELTFVSFLLFARARSF